MWNRGLGKGPGHGENQKHFGLALTETMMIETPILTLRHITWFISTSALITSPRPSPFPWLPVFQQGWLICSQPPPLCLCFYLPHLGCVVQHFDSEVCWTIHNPWLIQHSLPITYFCLQLADSGSPFILSAIYLSQMPFTCCQMHANLTCPTPQNQKLFPLLGCPSTQDLTCWVVAKRKLLKWMTYLDFICQVFLLPSLWLSFYLLK